MWLFGPPLLDSTLGCFQSDHIGALGCLSGVNFEVVVDGRVGGQYHCASCHPVLIHTLHIVALVFVHTRLLEDLAAHSGDGGSKAADVPAEGEVAVGERAKVGNRKRGGGGEEE